MLLLPLILSTVKAIAARLASLDEFLRKQFEYPGDAGAWADRALPARLSIGPDMEELAGNGATLMQSKVLPDDKMLPVVLKIPTKDRGGEPIVNADGSPWTPVGRIESADSEVILVEDNPDAPPAAFDEVVKRLRTPHVGATVVRFISGPFPDGSENVTEVAFAVPNSAPGEAIIKFGEAVDEPLPDEPPAEAPPQDNPETPPGA